MKSYDEATLAFNKGIELDPTRPDTFSHRGRTLAKQGKYIEALADYDKAINLNDKFADAWYNKGIALFYLGRVTPSRDWWFQGFHRSRICFTTVY
jgi:tetratricopeptide (TPR) repeat protein